MRVFQRLVFLAAILSSTYLSISQTNSLDPRGCEVGKMNRLLEQEYPELKDKIELKRQELEKFTKDFSKNRKNWKDEDYDQVLTIPMVFHVYHQNGTENISDEQIQSCINTLNEDFNDQNVGLADLDPYFKDITGSMNMRFKLAAFDPEGNPSNGIVRRESTLKEGVDQPAYKTDHHWPTEKYLNVYVFKGAVGATGSGWAYFPYTMDIHRWQDGIVVSHWAVGRIGTAYPSHYSLMSHEVGHWMNIKHIWGTDIFGRGDLCGTDDDVEDTPLCSGYSSFFMDTDGCDTTHYSCGTKNMIENHMDYADCPKAFTKGQAVRARAAMFSPLAGRNEIWRDENLIETGAIVGAVFTSNVQRACALTPVEFYGYSGLENTTEWYWEFEGGYPAFSTEQNPSVTWADKGEYTVKMTIKGGNGTELTRERRQFIQMTALETTVLKEGFENGMDEWEAINVHDDENDWMLADVGGYGKSDHSILISNDVLYGNGRKDLLYAPTHNNRNMVNLELQFDVAYKKYDKDANGELVVFASNDCGESYHEVYRKSGEDLASTEDVSYLDWIPAGSEWRTEIIDLSGFDGGEVINIRFENITNDGHPVYMDNVQISGKNNTVPVTEFSADVTEITVGDTVQFTNESFFNGGEILTYEWTFFGGTPSSFIGENPPVIVYNSIGAYGVKLKLIGDDNSQNIENKLSYIQVNSEGDYCIPEIFGRNPGYYGYFSNFKMGTINNTSGEGTYTDYSAIHTTQVLKTDSIEVAATIIAATRSGQNVTVWVDWNMDGDFKDSGEEIEMNYVGENHGGEATIKIGVPQGVENGWKRLRIRIQDRNRDECDRKERGEVEDYSIEVVDELYAVIKNDNEFSDDVATIPDSIDQSLNVSQNRRNEVKVYPNPTTGIFSIQHNLRGSVKLVIMDLSGRKVHEQLTSELKLDINLEYLPKGIYVVSLRTDNQIINKKVVIQ